MRRQGDILSCELDNFESNSKHSFSCNGPEPVTGYVGGSVRLRVNIENFQPAPRVAWLYRGSSNLLGTDPKYTVLPQGVVQISNIGVENKGDIQAIAMNPVDGSQMRSKFVTVTVLSANQRPPSKSSSSTINLIGKPQDIQLKWGRSTILECLADAPGTVSYSWLKNGLPLQMTGRYSMFGPGNLKITTATEQEAAKYTCKVQSGGAEMTADATVSVIVPPQFQIVSPSPIYGEVSGSVTMNYKVIGTPAPKISWMRDGVALPADASYIIFGDGTMTATGLIYSDSGMYQAFASNEAGEAQMSVELRIRRTGEVVTTTPIPTSKPGGSTLTPGKPKNVNAYAKAPTEMFVSWQPPDITNGEITSYKIVYFPTLEFTKFKTETISGDRTYTTIKDLEPNTEYSIKVGAINKYGTGALSTNYIAKTGSSTTNVVSSVTTGTITSSSIQLNWAAPSGSSVTKYVVYYSNVDATTSTVSSVETTSTTVMVNNLQPSTNYEFWIKAFSGDSSGPVSTRYKFKTHSATASTAVVNLRIASKSSSMVYLNWDVPAGVPKPDGHRLVFVDLDHAPASPSELVLGAVNTVFIQNLKASTNYKFKVVPYLNNVAGTTSNEVTAKTDVGVPSLAPKGLQVVSPTTSSLTIKWTPMTESEANGPILAYNVKYKIVGVKSSTQIKTIAAPSTSITTISNVLGGLNSDTEYSIRIAAKTSKGVGPFSSAVRGRTKKEGGPSAPLNFLVQINPAWPRQLILSWKEPTSSSDSIRRYEIYQSIEKEAWEKNEVARATMKLNVTSTRPGSEYRFKIRARDAITWGQFTDVLTVISMDDTIAPGPVRNLQSIATTRGLTVTWKEPANYRRVYVSGYEVIIRDKTEPGNVFDVIKLDGWSSQSYVISKGVKSQHTYECIVRAVNQKGLKSTQEVTTVVAPIATPVLKIDHVAVRKRSITFNWTDDLGTSRSKYFVTYTAYDDEGRGEMVSLEAFKPMITIKGLTPFTQYRFSVDREIAMAGTGATIIRTTMPDFPSAPVDVTARSNDTWVLLNWQVPLYPNGVIKTYKILYTADNTENDKQRISKDVGGNIMTYNVTGLTTGTLYYFNVIAVNDVGEGPKSETAVIQTGAGRPVFVAPGGKVKPGRQGAHLQDVRDWQPCAVYLVLVSFDGPNSLAPWIPNHDSVFSNPDHHPDDLDSKLWDGGKGAYVATPVNGFGKVKKDAPPDLWRGAGGGAAAMRVQETELQPLKANEFETAVPVMGGLAADSYHTAASNGSLNSSRSGAGVRVAVPGDATFISYKTSLNDYCHKTGWLQPHYNTFQEKGGHISNVVCGGHQYGGVGDLGASRQESEQRAAFFALQGIGALAIAAKFGADASITVPSPGEQSFISYKCSLHDFCQQCNILPPRFTTTVQSQGYGSQVNVGSYTFTTDTPSHSSQDAEQKVAYTALHGLSMMESSAQYSPNACFTVPGPGDASFISFKSSLHDFCQRYKLPPPQYITTQMAQGYSAKLKFGGLFFQSSDYFTTRLESEQHAAFEALQGLGLLDSGVKFGSGDTERVSSRQGSQLSLSSAGGEGRGLGSRAASHSRHGSASQLSYTSSTQQTSESSALYRSETTQAQSELIAGYGGAAPGIGGGALGIGGGALGIGGGALGIGGGASGIGGGASGIGGGASGIGVVSSIAGGASISGGTVNGYSGSPEGKTIFISKTTIPRVERSNSYGTAERTLEKSSESRFGNGMSYTVSYQHSTVRNVSTLPRKQQSYTSSNGGYSQFSSATTKLGSNRRAYSSSTAVNDDGGHKDFPEVRSSSHPALTDLEREMAGLEGLIKDLNGITASQQAVQT
eukprot:gene3659-14900_t